jgi:hypothetical protein
MTKPLRSTHENTFDVLNDGATRQPFQSNRVTLPNIVVLWVLHFDAFAAASFGFYIQLDVQNVCDVFNIGACPDVGSQDNLDVKQNTVTGGAHQAAITMIIHLPQSHDDVE